MANFTSLKWLLIFWTVTWLPPIALTVPSHAQSKDEFTRRRLKMVETAVIAAGVTDPGVIKSLRETPRHHFVPKQIRDRAYLDAGLPIGAKQTISSPFIVAYMTQELQPKPTDRVLEIGTGSGYQAAILSPLVDEVFSIEIVESLGRQAAKVLKQLNYTNVFTKIGDGYKGWEEHAPFDKIIVTCSPEKIPQPLVDQLVEGGTIVVPVGERHQQTLYLMKKVNGELESLALRPTLFVPMTGTAEEQRKVLPDPTNPRILNGDFEDGLDEKGFVKGWYYQRQMEWKEDVLAPSGQHYVKFSSKVPGLYSHLMQGFSIDGREVPKLKLTASLSCNNVA
ncbi:MAG: protein-L-isoaspartate(D-aspartate) O-methyltransferase, partial [Planctomycetota bacterium]